MSYRETTPFRRAVKIVMVHLTAYSAYSIRIPTYLAFLAIRYVSFPRLLPALKINLRNNSTVSNHSSYWLKFSRTVKHSVFGHSKNKWLNWPHKEQVQNLRQLRSACPPILHFLQTNFRLVLFPVIYLSAWLIFHSDGSAVIHNADGNKINREIRTMLII